ncbi:MAG: DUF4238 domain-containing protein, partial [Lachnospiraceae bacterium]|nr:DUF4238 domain-containing protein [Lachnospiraceae bacterium]
ILKETCFKEWLYELYDDNHDIIQESINYIERKLGIIENKVDIIFDKICDSESLGENEYGFLYAFIALQMLRMPYVLEFIKKYIGRIVPEEKSVRLENIARILSLDFKPESIVLQIILEFLLKYNMYVFKTKKALILSGDTPVSLYKLFENSVEEALIVFPFDSKHYILLTKGSFDDFYNMADNYTADFCNKLTLLEGNEYYSSERIQPQEKSFREGIYTRIQTVNGSIPFTTIT